MEYYRNKHVVVPGGAGFIGSHLTEKLSTLGARVTVIDNFQTGFQKNVVNSDIEVVHANIIDVNPPDADLIINLACPASPVHYQADPIGTWEASVLGIRNILMSAKTSGARVVHASTSEVYGDPSVHPQTEGYWGNVNPNGVRACYDEGKRAAETIAMDYHRLHGVDVRLPRIFNTYGPRMAVNDGRVVTNFISQALADQEITVFGDGTNTRSFCYVSDMVDALLRIGAADGLSGEVVNLGNPNEFTVMELAQKTIALTGSRSEIGFRELPQDDPRQRQPDISKAREMLGWEPLVQLDEGLEKTISFYANQGGAANQILCSSKLSEKIL